MVALKFRVALGVALFGALGALLRVWIASLLDRKLEALLPHAGTMAVNLVGCAVFGFVGGLVTGPWRVILLGGFAGAFTTYSTFGWILVDMGRTGRLGALAVHLLVHLTGGTLAVLSGLAAARAVARIG